MEAPPIIYSFFLPDDKFFWIRMKAIRKKISDSCLAKEPKSGSNIINTQIYDGINAEIL
jgi:hypothetical protein